MFLLIEELKMSNNQPFTDLNTYALLKGASSAEKVNDFLAFGVDFFQEVATATGGGDCIDESLRKPILSRKTAQPYPT